MARPFLDTSVFEAGVPTECTREARSSGPRPSLLWLGLALLLVVLLFSVRCALAAPLAGRAEHTDPALLAGVAEQMLAREAAGLGEAQVTVLPADAHLELPACTDLQAFLPPGAHAQGRTTVGVRCASPAHWTVYLQAQVRILGPYLAAAHPLGAGQVLAAGDVKRVTGDLAELPAGTLSDPDAAIGRALAGGLNTGQAIRRDAFRQQPVVHSGQTVRLLVLGQGFSVAGEGIATGNAGEGDTIQVRTAKGNLVIGVAHRGGTVEVRL